MPPSSPTVSVLMPAYNAGQYVADAVGSVLRQGFADFELVVVDDGSTDDTPAILRRLADADPRIRLVSRENRGLVATLNEMLGMARGEFAARLDADDVALPDRFARQVAFLREHPEVVCVGGASQLIDARGRRLTVIRPPEDDEAIQELALAGHTPINHPSAMMRLEAVRAVGGYREEMDLAEDLDLWLRLGEVGRLANLPDVLIEYRVHASSVCSTRQEEQLARMKAAADAGCDRRGIERRCRGLTPFRPGPGRASRHEHTLRFGWWAFNSGERSAALRYGLEAVRHLPWRSAGWRLLACALLKRPGVPRP